MPNPYPIALRERAVRAYEGSVETYVQVAARFSIHINTLVRWVQAARERGTVLPAPRGGGWYSPVDIPLLHALVEERPDRTTDELTRAYNQRAAPEAQVHRSSVLRALQRTGYVFKKKGPRPAEQDGPIVQAERRAFRNWLGRVDVRHARLSRRAPAPIRARSVNEIGICARYRRFGLRVQQAHGQ